MWARADAGRGSAVGQPVQLRGSRGQGGDFHGERRRNDSHASTTDPDARLFRKGDGKEARLCFMGHVLMENRHGLVVEAELTRAAGTPIFYLPDRYGSANKRLMTSSYALGAAKNGGARGPDGTKGAMLLVAPVVGLMPSPRKLFAGDMGRRC
jgi:hypothetical protein